MRFKSLFLLVFLALSACDDDGGGGKPTPTADGDVADRGPTEDATVDAAPADQGLMGRGVLEAGAPVLELGTAAVGQRREADLVLRNTGDGDLQVTAFNGLESGFTLSRQPPLRIPAGQERTLVVQFQPLAEGRVMATLSLVTDVPDAAPVEVVLRGTGGTPQGMLESPVVDFGVVAPGEQTAAFVRVVNTSDGIPLTIFALDGLAAPFSVPQGQLPAVGDVGGNAEVLVQFAPMEDGDIEQEVVVQSDAGDFMVTLRGRALSPGDLAVQGVEPAWGPTDADTVVVIHGGPFAAVPSLVSIGGTALRDVQRLDADRVQGVLPAGGEALGTDADQLDVRVEIGPAFGVATKAFVRTGPTEAGAQLDEAALATGAVGPAGNPWHLAIDTIPEGSELVVAPGTVILADGRTLTIEGVLRTGGDPGVVAFSALQQAPGAWGGLRFAANMMTSSLTDTVVEYAGAEGDAAVHTAQAGAFTRFTIRQSAGPGIEVDAGGTLVLLGGQITDAQGDAIRMLTPDGGWFRLANTWIRRCEWPIAAVPQHFGRQPLGPGHDWAGNTHAGIGIGGTVDGVTSLGNQPEPLFYALRAPITVEASGRFSLAAGAPLHLDGVLTVLGRLELPGGVRVQTFPGGRLELGPAATLVATGTPATPVTFEARDVGGAAQPGAWDGIVFQRGATTEITRLIVRDAGRGEVPAVDFQGGAGMINGLLIEDSAAAGLRLDGIAQISTLELRNNPGGIRIDGGAGRLEGTTTDPAPAVHFGDPALCDDWQLDTLLDGAGQPAVTDCP